MPDERTLEQLVDEAIASGRWTRSTLADAAGIHRTQLWRILKNKQTSRSRAAGKLRNLLAEGEMSTIEAALLSVLRRIIRSDDSAAQAMLHLLHDIESIVGSRR